MKIRLAAPVGPSSPAEDFDIVQVKRALNRLGYYVPYDKVGITGLPDSAVFDALKAFQKDHHLPATGAIAPGDETVRILSRKAAKTPAGSYVWRTVKDGKVRAAHASLNGTVRSWSDSPDPGEDYNCRCWAEPVRTRIYDPPIRPVYPELFLIPLLRIPKLHGLWGAWNTHRNTSWSLGKFKSDTRWANQLRNRNWTPEQITQTLKHGKKFPAPNKVNPKHTATRYEYENRYIVQDDQTKEILQVSGEIDFLPNLKE